MTEKQVVLVGYIEITSEVSVLFVLGDISSTITVFDLAVHWSARMQVVEISMVGIRSCLVYLSNYLRLCLYKKPNDVQIHTSTPLPNCVSVISRHCPSWILVPIRADIFLHDYSQWYIPYTKCDEQIARYDPIIGKTSLEASINSKCLSGSCLTQYFLLEISFSRSWS